MHTIQYLLSSCSYLSGNVTFALQKDAFLGSVGQGLIKGSSRVGQRMFDFSNLLVRGGWSRTQTRGRREVLIKCWSRKRQKYILAKCWPRSRKKEVFLGYARQVLVKDAVGQVMTMQWNAGQVMDKRVCCHYQSKKLAAATTAKAPTMMWPHYIASLCFWQLPRPWIISDNYHNIQYGLIETSEDRCIFTGSTTSKYHPHGTLLVRSASNWQAIYPWQQPRRIHKVQGNCRCHWHESIPVHIWWPCFYGGSFN